MRLRPHLSYLKYVLRHKWFVFIASWHCEVSLWRAIIHDWSKFLPCEWTPYVRSFYNANGTKREWKTRTDADKEAFNRAWNHHQKANKHHWQYWLLTNDSDDPKHVALPMPEKYAREMVADWFGAGRAITGAWGAIDWYAKNKGKIILHEQTRNQVEALLDEFLNTMPQNPCYFPKRKAWHGQT